MSFYLDLYSNSSMHKYPGNTLSSFKTYLPYPLSFDEPYECAMCEYAFPAKFEPAAGSGQIAFETKTAKISDKAVPAPKNVLDQKPTKPIPKSVQILNSYKATPLKHFAFPSTWDKEHCLVYNIPRGLIFRNTDEILAFLNGILQEHEPPANDPTNALRDVLAQTVIEPITKDNLPFSGISAALVRANPTPYRNVVSIRKALHGFQVFLRDKNVAFYLQGSAARMLGFNVDDSTWVGFREPGIYEFPHQTPDIQSEDPRLLNVYCNLIDPIIVGNQTAPLLRCIPIKGVNSEEKVYSNEVSSRQYLPINIQNTHEISIQIRDAVGNHPPFQPGLVYLRLHFRPQI